MRIIAASRLCVAAFLFIVPVVSVGCGGQDFYAQSGAESHGAGVRVVFDEVQHDIIKLVVINESKAPIVVYRDRVMLSTPNGTVTRESGGAGTVYTIEPGTSHKLNVRFHAHGVAPGTTVELRFQDAIQTMGKSIEVSPMPFTVR